MTASFGGTRNVHPCFHNISGFSFFCVVLNLQLNLLLRTAVLYWPHCLRQVSASNVGRACTGPARLVRPWGTSITQTASPAARVVSTTATCKISHSLLVCESSIACRKNKKSEIKTWNFPFFLLQDLSLNHTL